MNEWTDGRTDETSTVFLSFEHDCMTPLVMIFFIIGYQYVGGIDEGRRNEN